MGVLYTEVSACFAKGMDREHTEGKCGHGVVLSVFRRYKEGEGDR